MTAGFSVWQLAGGPTSRSYADVFLKYGVGLLGPGDAGRWTQGRKDEDLGGGFIRRFATEMRVGDLVLLRTGIATIVALGVVAGPYEYLEQFDDVNGWDLQHGRRIRWCVLPQPYTFTGNVFGSSPPRVSQVWKPDVLNFAVPFLNSPPTEWQSAVLPGLPKEEPSLDDIPAALQEIVAKVQDLVPLFWDETAFGCYPKEDEMVAHFVVPFLYALGWPPELIAIKWQNIDVAVFSTLPRIPQNCQLVIESKRFGAGVEGALNQAVGYVESLGLTCDVMVTDGIRYRMYSYINGFTPVAYANLILLKESAISLFDEIRKI